ncbi:MAG: S41 family peptidase [Bacteroidota bacterium]
MKTISKWFRLSLIPALIITIAVSYSFTDNDFEISKNLDIFATLYKELNFNYVDEINSGDLMKKGIDAMLESLDPYTVYIPESKIEDYKLMTTGQYGGVGALIQKRENDIIISDPYEGFPADKAGLKAGDKILEVNGNSTKGKSVDDISSILRGQPGTTITIRVERDGESKPFEKTLLRENVKLENIPYSGLLDDFAYIKLNSFTENAGREVRDAFMKCKEKDSKLKGVIVDLRGNGGGLLQEAVNIVNIFTPQDVLVVDTRSKYKERNYQHKTVFPGVDETIPLAILVDKGSASASEIVSGAIQDLDRGVIIGQRTYGKGLVQNIFPLSYNTQLKVTIAKYYIPSGRCIQEKDYSHRDADGEVQDFPDSLKKAFKTKGGRVVYDGRGIEPDVHIDPASYSNLTFSLISKFLVFDFATLYYRENKTIPSAESFEITDEIWSKFQNFIKSKEYDYTTNTEKNLEKLKDIAEKEKYFDAIQSEYNNLKTKLKHDKNADLIKFKDEIKIMLKDEIVGRYYYQKGKIISSLKDDPEILKAKEILNNNELYKSILNGTYKKEKSK